MKICQKWECNVAIRESEMMCGRHLREANRANKRDKKNKRRGGKRKGSSMHGPDGKVMPNMGLGRVKAADKARWEARMVILWQTVGQAFASLAKAA